MAAWCLSGWACGSPPENFYVLRDSTPAAALPAVSSRSFTGAVMVGPVSLPDFVDRPQLVVQSTPDRVTVLEQQRWAEPLKVGIARLMAAQLSRLLGSTSVSSTDDVLGRPDLRVSLDVRRFETDPGRAVTLETLWTVRAAEDRRNGHTLVQEPIRGAGYEAVVAADGRAFEAVSRQIAEAVSALGGHQ
jgi:uncharacterized lipoprotein YmbA